MNDAIKALLRKYQCGDSSCIFGRSGGMMTNSGCRDLKGDGRGAKQLLQRFVFDLRAALEAGTEP